MIKRFPIKFSIGLLLLLYSTFSYFINTNFDMTIFFVCLIIYLFIFVDIWIQFYKTSKVDFKEKSRNWLIGFYAFILIIVGFKPTGIINFDKLGSKTILTAFAEGVASCTETIIFKQDNTYRYTSICFGKETKIGHYKMKNDTIYFDKNSDIRFKYGVIRNNSLELFLKEKPYKRPFKMMITRNR